MKNPLVAALALAAVAVAALPAFAQEGPRPSSGNNWTGMTDSAAPAAVPTVTPFEGPRPSSENNWSGMTNPAAPAYEPAVTPFDGPRPSSAR